MGSGRITTSGRNPIWHPRAFAIEPPGRMLLLLENVRQPPPINKQPVDILLSERGKKKKNKWQWKWSKRTNQRPRQRTEAEDENVCLLLAAQQAGRH